MITFGSVPADVAPAQRPGHPENRPGDERAGLRIPITLGLVMLISAGAAAAAAAGPDAFGDGFWDNRTQAVASATAKAAGVLGACGAIGALVVSVFLVDAGDRGGRATRLRATRAAAPWAALWCLGTVVSAAVLFGRADGGPADGFAWSMRSLVATAWATAMIAVLVRGRPSPSTDRAALALAVAAVMGSVAGGHAWHTEDRLVVVSSLVVHVLAVAAWLGCLLVLAVHLPRASRADAAMLHRFSSLALVCFVLVAASGTANVVSRLGLTELLDSGTYGALLAAKLALFGLVGFLGLAHRRRTLPRFADGDSRPFWVLVAGELVLLVAVVGLGAALAGASPADGGAGDDVHAAVRI